MNQSSVVPTLASARVLQTGLLVWLIGSMVGEGVVFAGAGITLLGVLLALREEQQWPSTAGIVAWLAYSAFALTSAVWAVRPVRSGTPWSALHWLFFPVAALAFQRMKRVELLLRTFVILAIVSGVFAVLQHYYLASQWPLLGQLSSSVWRLDEPAEDGGYKAGGLHFHRLRYAHTMVPLLFALLPMLRRRTAALVALVACVGLYFTYTRASWLALAAGVLAFVIFRPGMQWGALAILAIPFVWVGPPDRGVAWATAKQLFLEHPWRGVGYGGYPTAALQQMGGVDPNHPFIHFDAHSLLLEHLAEVGTTGTLLWMMCVFLYTRTPFNRARFASLVSLCVLGIVHNWAFHPVVLATAALALAAQQVDNVVLGQEGNSVLKARQV